MEGGEGDGDGGEGGTVRVSGKGWRGCMNTPVQICDVFVDALKHLVEPCQNLQMIISKLLIAILQLLHRVGNTQVSLTV